MPWKWQQTKMKIQRDENQCIKYEKRNKLKRQKHKKDIKHMRKDDGSVVTTDRTWHSRHSYLERPWHRCWWRTWSWDWGCCCPHCGTWRVSPHSAVPGSPRCSGTCSGMANELHRCRGDTAGWRKACRHTLCPKSSLWSDGLEGTWAEKRLYRKAKTRDTWETVR